MNSGVLKVLVADDDMSNRLLLEAILQKEGYEVLHAEDGVQATEVFAKERPDLVLMDIRMPHMDGYEATQRIKEMSGDRFVPVIFLTANTDIDSLVKSVESGGDDFLSKPYNRIQLQARINALMRIRDLYRTVHEQRNELLQHQKRLERERQVAKRLFTNIVNTDSLNRPDIKYHLSPLSLFSGDILLAAPKPSGGVHVILGDFTGHGLAAATGALPVSSIFYGMTAKGFSIGEIVTEINGKLKSILPTGMFLAACVVDMDPTTHTLSVWNGGIPSLVVYDAVGRKVSQRVHSRHLPLGIAPQESFDRRADVVEMRDGHRVFMCTDGVTETLNPKGEMFGRQRFEALIADGSEPHQLFDQVLDSLIRFQAGERQRDDVTLVELEYNQQLLEESHEQSKINRGRVAAAPSHWGLSLCLGGTILRDFEPLPLIIQALMDMQGFNGQRQHLYTIFSELFSNALEHGLLGLDSSLKKTADGFARYYQDRERKLAALSDGEIRVDIRHQPEAGGGKLIVSFQDTGPGFDFRQEGPNLNDNLGHSGRGIQLLRSMCDEVSYKNNGTCVEVVYRWH